MLLAIFIFIILILILQANIRIHIKSINDTLKLYFKIGILNIRVPHHNILRDLLSNMNSFPKRDKINKARGLTINILSHSVLDYIYIAKFSKEELYNNPISNGLYLIVSNQIRGLLQSLFRIVDYNNVRLIYDNRYENIDYYLEAHISVINLICALASNIFKKR